MEISLNSKSCFTQILDNTEMNLERGKYRHQHWSSLKKKISSTTTGLFSYVILAFTCYVCASMEGYKLEHLHVICVCKDGGVQAINVKVGNGERSEEF